MRYLTICTLLFLLEFIKATSYEMPPSFPGGDSALRAFMKTNLQYPEQAKKKGIQGRVYVEFTISKSGDVKDVRILKGVDNLLNKEALRLIRSMPKWKPGKIYKDSRMVFSDIDYRIPVNFKIKNIKPPSFSTESNDIEQYITSKLGRYNKYSGNAVYVNFNVKIDGSLSKIRIQECSALRFKKEALSLVKEMPNWTAGEKDGKKKKLGYTLIIYF